MKNETIHTILSIFTGGCAYLLGGFDTILLMLFIVMGVDLVTGMLKSLKEGKFNPKLFLWGLVNKIVTVLIVITVHIIQVGMSIGLPLREAILMLLSINEALSVLRNATSFVSGLEPLTKYFESVKITILKIFKVGD